MSSEPRGVFGAHDTEAAAAGRFVHVWVERAARRPVAIPERVRAALEALRRQTAA